MINPTAIAIVTLTRFLQVDAMLRFSGHLQFRGRLWSGSLLWFGLPELMLCFASADVYGLAFPSSFVSRPSLLLCFGLPELMLCFASAAVFCSAFPS